MDYNTFKKNIMNAVTDFYGKDADVRIKEVLKNNGKRYDGIYIMHDTDFGQKEVVPVIYLDMLYEKYVSGDLEMEECIGTIIDFRERQSLMTEIEEFAGSVTYWEKVKTIIYPILLSKEENAELLENLVTDSFLDLSIVYIIRRSKKHEGSINVKVTKTLFAGYGITKEELHRQAVDNLEKDGYMFYDMKDLLEDYIREEGKEECVSLDKIEDGKMYILTNSSKTYGAAGILHKRLLKEYLGNCSCYILPSSLHETIFIPASTEKKQSEMDLMVKEVNSIQVDLEERLSNHSYYYDAQKEEIRIKA